ncbi:MAG: NusG domain II-containing protein [Intestinimonas sp.]|jgi:hypothetical protein|nr:NusG domain II-containing protein [Intestinimonas sp.]
MNARSSAADRTRPTLLDGAVVLFIVVAAVALFIALKPAGGSVLTATVTVDGQVIAQYDLTHLTEPETLEVSDVPYPLVIRAEPGRIRVEKSSCPDNDCVHIGWISSAGGQIICLPNRLIISVTGSSESTVDGVTG